MASLPAQAVTGHPRHQPWGRWTVDEIPNPQSPIPNTLCDPIAADLGTHMDDASRVCCCDGTGTGTGTGLTAFAQRRRLPPSIPPTAFPVPSQDSDSL